MVIELTAVQSVRLKNALHECMEIAREYRRSIADEDSIVLSQDLHSIAELLGVDIDSAADGGHSDSEGPVAAEGLPGQPEGGVDEGSD